MAQIIFHIHFDNDCDCPSCRAQKTEAMLYYQRTLNRVTKKSLDSLSRKPITEAEIKAFERYLGIKNNETHH